MILKNPLMKTILIIIGIIASIYLIVYIDLTLRAYESYREAEKYWRWHFDPDLKKTALKNEFEKEKSKLDKKLKNKKISQQDYKRELEILEFEYETKLKESSIKYAYIWYKTAVELFSPPRSKWVKLCEEKLPKAKELWKKELTEKGIKFEDYMLE